MEVVIRRIAAGAGGIDNSVIEQIEVAEEKMCYGCFCVDCSNLMQYTKFYDF